MSPNRGPIRPLAPAIRLSGLSDSLHMDVEDVQWFAGPPGAGKTTLLQALFRPSGAFFWEVPPLEGPALQADFDRLLGAVFGDLPPLPTPPDPLSFRGSEAWWMRRFQELIRALARGARSGAGAAPGAATGTAADSPPAARPPVLVVDGIDTLRLAGRRVPELLIRSWALEGRSAVQMVVASAEPEDFVAVMDEGRSEIVLPGVATVPVRLHRLEPHLPYRVAAERHGARDATDALIRWSIFGGFPGFLPRTLEAVRGSVREGVIRRVLEPSGDLHDAPLEALRGRVQAPARYLGILFALAHGERQWGDMARLAGVQSGNQLAPYLRKLEAEGWIRVVHPLDGKAGGRRRRYEITDPFIEFWMAHVFPWRSLLRQMEPSRFYAEFVQPALPTIVHRGLARVALAYLEHHARETLPAAARVVGRLWAEGVEIPAAARLANGQVCYGWIGSMEHRLDEHLFDALTDAMEAVRWGMGREARAPLFFLPGPPEEGLRRRVARNPLARILTPERLFAADVDGEAGAEAWSPDL
jgi:hypothetical protein